MAVRFLVAFSFCNYLMQFTGAVPEPGIKDVVLSKTAEYQYGSFQRDLGCARQNLRCAGETEKNTSELKLGWRLYKSECAQAFMQVKDDDKVPPDDYKSGSRLLSSGKHFNIAIHLTKTVESRRTDEVTTVETGNVEPAEQPNTRRHKREASRSSSRRSNRRSTKKQRKTNKPKTKKEKSKNKSTNKPEKSKNKPTNKPEKSKKNPTTEAGSTSTEKATTAGTRSSSTKASHVDNSQDGNYLLVIRVQNSHGKEFRLRVKVTMKSSTGYLSAAEWPLLPFYGAMSLVYLAYGVVWLIVSACQWRELLRIQFWIGGVIALGMLEKAILFSEYNNVNNFGTPAHGLVVFAQVLSCFKRTLSRILIIIVSMGFGIVKPRLGGALQRVLGVGCLYFILCVIEGSYREITFQADVNRKQLLAAVPLSVLDAVICWWIFMSLMQTMRTLRIRKNIVKLSLYRHFTNILVASVVVSVAFMIWVIRSQHFNTCIKDWKELWIDDAFWHFLFVLVLLAIMILWRPTANNQRYAFTPLIDVGDDGDDDMTLSDAFQGMKMRNKSEGEAPTRTEKTRNKVEDDLKWVEENIPTAGGGIDTALPTLLDSDEEVMTTKLEMSKME